MAGHLDWLALAYPGDDGDICLGKASSWPESWRSPPWENLHSIDQNGQDQHRTTTPKSPKIRAMQTAKK
ncbi:MULTISPECIES: hypothetical protein [unclassified Synechocystis]|uniref:hypothetical protein n=1 Tax=unclassified Synechocystis TaxID=2640012 RepID=UPI0004D192F9|nr:MULTISPECIES: hypothetical protein [unclassified Synechocystis]AIE75199.1 hypothetical protein D082_26710 [Synechocystis sp. PCC 6714]